MTLSIRVDAAEVKKALDGVRERFEQPRDMLQEIGDIIVEDIRNRIVQRKKDPKEIPWAPWKPATAAARQRKGNAKLGLLYDTGRLLRSITSEVKNHGGNHGGWMLRIGTNVPYAKYLNDGTEKMVARPFLGVSQRAQGSINEAVQMYMKESFKK